MHNIHYTIKPSNPQAHIYSVSCLIQQPERLGQRVSLPAWIPGSYLIRDFAKNIITIKASANGQPINLIKLGKDAWQCAPADSAILIEYEVYAWDLSVRTAHLDTTHGFFNGTSVFLRVHDQEQQPCSVEIQAPDGYGKQWKVATSLSLLKAKRYAFGVYQAEDYHELVDHPVEMGTFELIEFKACGVTHAVALTGKHACDTERLKQDLQQLCEYQIRFFGEPAPMDYYIFLVTIVGAGYGGLEHRNSCSLLCARNTLPEKNMSEISDAYLEFLGLCSHEYFHTWNVKRIKPAAFTPYDYQKENYTKLLWAFEGITCYYEGLALLHSGLITPQRYLQLLGQTMTRVTRGKGRLRQTVADSSYYAWTKFYQQDENAPNAIVSYYTKGELVALCLDGQIREKTANKKSLDDLMKILWERYGKTQQGVPEAAIEEIAMEIAGVDLTEFFDLALRSTEDLPLEKVLEFFGVNLHWRAAESQNDKGGKPAKTAESTKVELGIRSKAQNHYPKIITVYEDSSAQRAGLAAGDVIIAIDHLQVTASNWEKRLQQYSVSDEVEMHIFRRDELMQFTIQLQTADATTAYLESMSDPNAEQQRNYQAWLCP